jgi:hypothetical protein
LLIHLHVHPEVENWQPQPIGHSSCCLVSYASGLNILILFTFFKPLVLCTNWGHNFFHTTFMQTSLLLPML